MASSSSSSPPALIIPATIVATLTTLGAAAFVARSFSSRSTSKSASTPNLAAKPVSDSSISYRYKIDPTHCDENNRCYGGELLKVIDVTAGAIAAKHSQGRPCATVSVDRVIFLSEIMVGDVIQLSGAVNRSWGSSMEIGVRVMRETAKDPLGHQSYCCHAYLTFVAKPADAPEPPLIFTIAQSLGVIAPAPKKIKVQLAPVQPLSTIEHKRYLLAGRRRAHRIQGSKTKDAMLSAFREQVLALEAEHLAATSSSSLSNESGKSTEAEILALQTEVIVEAYLRKDHDVRVEGDYVVAEIEGFMDAVKVPLSEIRKASRMRGHGGWKPINLNPPTQTRNRSLGFSTEGRSVAALYADTSSVMSDSQYPLEMVDTLVNCLWIVRPQFVNSKSVLFGGTLMRWIEEASAIAARRVLPSASWSSGCIDSLTFKSPVHPGEVVYIRACVIKVFDSSIEVYVVVMAEDRHSPDPKPRLVSESFFTLIAIDSSSGRPLKGKLRSVNVPDGPAREVAKGADKRRESRLLDKMILQRVYA